MNLNDYAKQCHEDNEKWWHRLACIGCNGFIVDNKWCTNPRCTYWGKEQTPIWIEFKNRNKGELLMLIVSELSEAMEGLRKDLMDDKLPHRKMAEVELADALIRIFDFAGAFGFDIEGAYQEKRLYNQTREDHKHEARMQSGGKKF